MTDEEIAYKLQGIYGLLLKVAGQVKEIYPHPMNRYLPIAVHEMLQGVRDEVIALARQFEPPLETISPERMAETLRYLRETPHTPANRSEDLKERMTRLEKG